MAVMKASPVEMRKAIEAAEFFAKNGIYFIPVPVCGDHEEILKKVQSNLEKLAELAEE